VVGSGGDYRKIPLLTQPATVKGETFLPVQGAGNSGERPFRIFQRAPRPKIVTFARRRPCSVLGQPPKKKSFTAVNGE